MIKVMENGEGVEHCGQIPLQTKNIRLGFFSYLGSCKDDVIFSPTNTELLLLFSYLLLLLFHIILTKETVLKQIHIT